MNTKHTPATWHCSQSPAQRAFKNGILGRISKSVKNKRVIGGKIIANAYGDTVEEAEANAKLIAAAPELLEALKECLEGVKELNGEYQDGWESVIEKAQSAINKATE